MQFIRSFYARCKSLPLRQILKEKKMSKKHKKYIPEPKFEYIEVWEEIEESEPDISTERLAAMVADRCDCDVDDVFEALVNTNN